MQTSKLVTPMVDLHSHKLLLLLKRYIVPGLVNGYCFLLCTTKNEIVVARSGYIEGSQR